MSLLSNIGRAVGTAVRQVSQVASYVPGPIGTVAKGISAITGSGSRPQVPMPFQPPPMGILPSLPGVIQRIGGVAVGAGIGGVVNRIAGGTATQGGCGCNGKSGRDPCTGQRMTNQAAPLATFFGGCCPPGRVLRRVNNGRDICARKARMNPFNPQALARADRRVTTFARRATPILRDLGFQVSRSRKPKIAIGKKRKRG